MTSIVTYGNSVCKQLAQSRYPNNYTTELYNNMITHASNIGRHGKAIIRRIFLCFF